MVPSPAASSTDSPPAFPMTASSKDKCLLAKQLIDVTLAMGDSGAFEARRVMLSKSQTLMLLIKQLHQNSTVKIPGVTPRVMELILEFLYCGCIEKFGINAFGVFEAALKFNLPKLEEMCKLELQAKMPLSAFADAYITAEESGVSLLKSAVVEFIKQ